MVQATATEFVESSAESSRRASVAAALSRIIFGSLLLLMMVAAVPYGTADQWWKGIFSSLVFLLATLWIVEGLLSGSWSTGGLSVLLPALALAALALVQTIPFGGAANPAGVSRPFWHSISADPYQTRFFLMQLLALTVAAALFYRYANTEFRINAVIFVIVGIALLSALFGITRQAAQHQMGFGLPRLKPEMGYGQFINKNHFAFLMEMAFGLVLGLLIAGRTTKEKAVIYISALLPIWTALVLSNSRGGLLAMMAQLVFAVMFFGLALSRRRRRGRVLQILQSWPVRIGLATVLVIVCLVGTVWIGGERLVSNIESVRTEFDETIAASHVGGARTDTWRATLKMIKAHPIAGVGMGGYWVAVTAYHDASGVLTPQEAHNDYLELLASGGIIGLIIGGWFAFAVVKRIRYNLKFGERFQRTVTFAATLGIAGVAVHSLVDFGLHMLANALIFVALLTIATRLDNKTCSSHAPANQ